MDQPSLLPPNGTAFMRALEQATAYETRLSSGIETIYNIKGRRLPDWLSYLLYEYGLLELTPYVTNPYILLEQGRDWQNERDTWAAILRGLGWVGAPGQIVEAPARRFWWNSFQIYLDSLPPFDVPDLERIDRVTQLGKPFRSDFRRGVHGYDIPAFEADRTRLDGSLLDTESGVRLRAGGPRWSFGRLHEVAHVLTEDEGIAIGNWLPAVADEEYAVDLKTLTATLDGEPIPFSEAVAFERAGPKWHSDLAGNWYRFLEDAIAATDRGSLIEAAATRLSTFNLLFNPVEDEAAATVIEIDVDDPFGGNDAIRVEFDGDAGNVLYIPAEGLIEGSTYSVSFFARLVAVTGSPGGVGGPGFVPILDQLVADEYVRVTGEAFVSGSIAGQWFDLTLDTPGATIVVDLFGFQIEAGAKATSPIEGEDITGERAADELALLLPDGLNNIGLTFDDGSGQSFLQVEGTFPIDPAGLNRPIIAGLGNLSAAIWRSMAFPWTEATFPWNSDAASQRAIILANWFEGQDAYFALSGGDGSVIGYRRARIVRQASGLFGGPIKFAGAGYQASASGQFVFAEALTAAGDGAGNEAKNIALIIGAARKAGVPPGQLWLAPDELLGGEPIAARSVTIPLRQTVRERVKLLLRF